MNSYFYHMEEIWKRHSDHPGYEFSNCGNIRSYWSHSGIYDYNRIPKLLKPGLNKDGYRIVTLAGKKSYILHRLIAQVFIENPNGYPTVDHIDKNRSNNLIANLRWASHVMQKENVDQIGENNSNCKTNWEQVKRVFDLREKGYTQQKISDITGIGRPSVSKILLRKNWKKI